MASKLFLTSILVFFPVDLQMPFGMAWIASFIVLVLLMQPYIRQGDDRMAMLVQTELLMILLAGATLIALGSFAPGSSIDIAMSVVLISATIVILIIFLAFAFIHARLLLREHARNVSRSARKLTGSSSVVELA